MPSSRTIPLLSHLPTFDQKTGDLTVVIETPKGSPNKYDYDSRYGAFRFAAVLPEGMSFPFDFGFVPSTLGDDGDPLDVLVLMDASTPVGCILSARLLGVIKARQRERDGEWIQNDRLLAVATRSRRHTHLATLHDLRPELLAEIEAFFAHYNELAGKEFQPVDRCGPDDARELVKTGIDRFSQAENANRVDC
ncbi:MAG: inorganic diphosphatase [Alphaproteobacteria bacterium]|nr:inorganic diphosphatase [Alphaproteobacteria bacterium]